MDDVPKKHFGVLMSVFVVLMAIALVFLGVAYLYENDLPFGANLMIVLFAALLFLLFTRRFYARARSLVLGVFPFVTLILLNTLSGLLHRAMTGPIPPEHDYSFLLYFPLVTLLLVCWGVLFDRVKNRVVR